MSKSARHRLAIFGLGRAGKIHFKNLLCNHRAEVVYVMEQDVGMAKEVVTEYNSNAVVVSPNDIDQVLNDKSLDGVVICTPTYTHQDLVTKAFQKEKAVFCEKPISETYVGTKSCYAAAKKANKPLLCSFNRRFDPSLQSMHSRVRSGELGVIQTIKSSARDHPFPPLEFLKHSGGMFHDTGVHDIDLITWLLDEYPENVFAFAHCHNETLKSYGDVDTAVIVMKFASGTLATFDYSRNSSYGYDQRCEVFGSKGMLVNENQRSSELVCHNANGSFFQPMKYSFPERYSDSYIGAMNNFLDVLAGKSEPAVTAEQTLKVSTIAAACEESHKTGKQVTINYEYDKS